MHLDKLLFHMTDFLFLSFIKYPYTICDVTLLQQEFAMLYFTRITIVEEYLLIDKLS